MKKLVKILLVFLFCICLYKGVYAASTNLSASSTSIEEGKTTTIYVNVSDCASWNLSVSASGLTHQSGSLADAGAAANGISHSGNVITAVFKGNTKGTYTVKLTGQIADKDLNKTNVSKNIYITVKEKTVTPPPVPPPTFSSVNQTVYTTDQVNIRSSYSTTSNIVATVAKGTSITRTGIGDNGWSRVSYNGRTAYINSSYLTTTKPNTTQTPPTTSSNNYLQSLTLEPGGLSPVFNKNTTSYILQVDNTVESVKVNAKAEDSKATISISGNTNLKDGENIVKIIVKAENGGTRTYTINVIKGQDVPLILQSLVINGVDQNGNQTIINLNPTFALDVFEYYLEVPNEIQSLKIDAISNSDLATIQIEGADKLIEGINIVTINLKLPDSDGLVTYTINVTRLESNIDMINEQVEQDEGMFFNHRTRIILIIVLTIIIAIMGIIYGILEYRYSKNKKAEKTIIDFTGTVETKDKGLQGDNLKPNSESQEKEKNDFKDEDGKDQKGKHF